MSIRGGTFHIAEGCSGKRYFIVTLAVAVLGAAIYRMRGVRALAYVLACGVLALVANWIRIIIVIYAGHIAGMQAYLVAVEHLTLGNVIFVCLLVLVLLLARAVAPASTAPVRRPWTSDSFPGTAIRAAARCRSRRSPPRCSSRRSQPRIRALRTPCTRFRRAVCRSPPAAGRGHCPGLRPGRRTSWALPGSAGRPTPRPQEPWELYVERVRRAAPGTGTRAIRQYAAGARHLAAGVATGDTTFVATGAVAGELRGTHRRWQALGPRVSLRRRWLVHSACEPLAQLAYGLQAIRRPVPSGVVALAVRCDTDCAAARALATAFWDDMSGPILGMLPHSGQDR